MAWEKASSTSSLRYSKLGYEYDPLYDLGSVLQRSKEYEEKSLWVEYFQTSEKNCTVSVSSS